MTEKVTKEEQANAKEEDPLTLWQILAPVQQEVYTGMALSAASGVVWIYSVVLLQPIARVMLEEASTASDSTKEQVYYSATQILVCILAAIVMRFLSFNFSHRGAFRLEENLRTQLTTHLAKVPLGYVVTTGSGTLKKVLMDDVRSLHAFVADSTPLMARAYVVPPATFLAMLCLGHSWRMCLVSLLIFPMGFTAMSWAFTDYDEGQAAMDQAQEHMNNTIIEFVQGMQVVRTFDDGKASFGRYRKALEEATRTLREWSDKTKYGAYIARTLFSPLPTMAIVVIAGVYWIQMGDAVLDVPTFLLFLCLAPTLADSIVPMVWMLQLINTSNAGARRIGTLLVVPELPQPRDPSHTLPKDASVYFENVTFTYANRTEPALQNVSITMKEGSVTALVGPSGAGKSTVARLIPRFWDVQSGTIRVGGVDVRDMATDTLMQQVSFVFQQPFLLNDTIRANILLGNPLASDQQVINAAKAAHAHDFIMEQLLPHQYDTMAGDRGARLSGGQRQRITIARAILQNSPIVVLDEATAFADPENEALIHAAIAKLTRGKTLIVVAHRLSTIQDADQIVVLNSKGQVAQIGKHEELVKAGGIYANLWEKFNQAQGWGLRSGKK